MNNVQKLKFDPKEEARKLHETELYEADNTNWLVFNKEMKVLHKDWSIKQIAMVYDHLCVYIRQSIENSTKKDSNKTKEPSNQEVLDILLKTINDIDDLFEYRYAIMTSKELQQEVKKYLKSMNEKCKEIQNK